MPSLRSIALFNAVRDAIGRTGDTDFRVLHFSVQQDHVHAIIEGDSHDALTAGLRGLVIRIALAVKSVARVRKVWGDRYHARPLKTPWEVRHAIIYVLLNFSETPARSRGDRSPQLSGLVRRLGATDASTR